MASTFQTNLLAQLARIVAELESEANVINKLNQDTEREIAQNADLIADDAYQAKRNQARLDDEIAALKALIADAKNRHNVAERTRIEEYCASAANVQKDRDETNAARQAAEARQQELHSQFQVSNNEAAIQSSTSTHVCLLGMYQYCVR